MHRAITTTVIAGLLALTATNAGATVNYVTNGDFETGTLDAWAVFTTAGGSNGPDLPDVVPFDIDDDGTETQTARFDIGRLSGDCYGARAGGGIHQEVTLPGGNYQYTASIATLDDRAENNEEGGLFELLFDGDVVDSHDFGDVTVHIPEYALLVAELVDVSEGAHEVSVRITRTLLSGRVSPYQYVDNVSLIPEPTTAALLALGALALRRKRRT